MSKSRMVVLLACMFYLQRDIERRGANALREMHDLMERSGRRGDGRAAD